MLSQSGKMRKHLPCLFAHFLPLIGRNLVKCQNIFHVWLYISSCYQVEIYDQIRTIRYCKAYNILYNIGLTVHDLVHHVEHNATRSLVLCVCFVNHCLTFCTFSFGHCVVLYDIRILITPFGIFKLFCITYNKLYTILSSTQHVVLYTR